MLEFAEAGGLEAAEFSRFGADGAGELLFLVLSVEEVAFQGLLTSLLCLTPLLVTAELRCHPNELCVDATWKGLLVRLPQHQ